MSHRSRRVRVTAFLAGILPVLAGCASDSDVLARIGSASLRVDDALTAARGVQLGVPVLPDSARAWLLEELVRRELFVQAALREGLHRDTSFLDEGRRIEEQLLRQRVFLDRVGDPGPVSDAEIGALYAARAVETRCRLVFTLTREAASAALREIRGGADFAEVADRFSHPGSVPAGGDVGFLAPGSLDPALDAPLESARPGEVAGPIEARGLGWFLVRVEARRPRVQPPLEIEREQLAETLRQRKQRGVLLLAMDRLRAAHAVKVRRGAAQELASHVLPSAFRQATPPPTGGERAMVLADHAGGVYTLGDALDDLAEGRGPRPQFLFLPTVQRWIESRLLDRAVLREARARLFHEEPEVRRAVREAGNNELLARYLDRQVLRRVAVAEADAREEYLRDPAMVPGSQRFEALLPETRAALEHRALERKRERRLNALADSLRGVIPVVSYPERLRRLPWPIPLGAPDPADASG